MDCFLRMTEGLSVTYLGNGGTGGNLIVFTVGLGWGIMGEVALDISFGVFGLGINEGVTDRVLTEGDMTLSILKSPKLLFERSPTVDC
ncbi:hypothetical protein RMATCC62417_18352 [Rhizopus microsporus]|nr:hypothetical protein RMATCC62417_18352 [Rhizopus microsporus]